MELRHLRYFVAVAEELHFRRAAERLHMSQPPLSRQIQELEDEIGFPLFAREYHKVELTPAGAVYLREVKQILEHVEVARQQAADVAHGRTGRLRLGHGAHLPEAFLSRVVAMLGHVAPGVSIDLLESPTPRVIDALRKKTIDVGFVIARGEIPGLLLKPLLREPLVIVVPEGHRYATEPLTDLIQLAQDNFVLCRRYDEAGFREVIEDICRRAGFTPRVVQAAELKQTVLSLVAEGLGVSIVQASAAERDRGVCYLPFPKSAAYVDTALAWRDDAPLEVIAHLVAIAEREAAILEPHGGARADVPTATTAAIGDGEHVVDVLRLRP